MPIATAHANCYYKHYSTSDLEKATTVHLILSTYVRYHIAQNSGGQNFGEFS